MQYEKYLFFLPGIARDVLVDIANTEAVGKKSSIESISVEGQDVFYAHNGETLVSNAEIGFCFAQTVGQFEDCLASNMVIPIRHLKLTYSFTPEPDWSMVVPHYYRIQRVTS